QTIIQRNVFFTGPCCGAGNAVEHTLARRLKPQGSHANHSTEAVPAGLRYSKHAEASHAGTHGGTHPLPPAVARGTRGSSPAADRSAECAAECVRCPVSIGGTRRGEESRGRTLVRSFARHPADNQGQLRHPWTA